MIAGESIYVSIPVLTGTDDFGNEVWEHGQEDPGPITWGDLLNNMWGGGDVPSRHRSGFVQVDNVLVNPSTTTYDRIEPGRPTAWNATSRSTSQGSSTWTSETPSSPCAARTTAWSGTPSATRTRRFPWAASGTWW